VLNQNDINMKKKIFTALLSLFAVAGFALAESEPLDLKVNDSKRKKERIRKQKLKDSIANSFEHFVLDPYESMASQIEHRFIKRGDSVRIRHLFRPDYVKRISSRSLGCEIPPQCLMKGEWIITLKPDTTQWIDFNIETFRGRPTPGGFLIIVIDPEKYDDVKREYDKVKDDYAKRQDFYDSLSGKPNSEYFREELKRAGFNIP
jgi:hypothetical protein